MITKIKYLNNRDKEISFQQTIVLTFYKKMTYENNELRKIEEYRNGELIMGSLYPQQGEIYSSILNQDELSKPWIIYDDKISMNNCIFWKGKYYKNGVLSSKYNKGIYNLQGDYIAIQEFDEDNNATSGILKMYYLKGKPIVVDGIEIGYFEEDNYICFDYSLNGDVKISMETGSMDESYYDLQEFLDDHLNSHLLYNMTPDELAYYTSETQLIPSF